MRGVEIDPVRRTAKVAAGALWEDVVDAAAPHGLYPLHGSSPTVGVVGYSLGGGMGWLARSHGLQTNSVTAIELVRRHPEPTEAQIREGLEGNICRCTGYHNIVKAIAAAAIMLRQPQA